MDINILNDDGEEIVFTDDALTSAVQLALDYLNKLISDPLEA